MLYRYSINRVRAKATRNLNRDRKSGWDEARKVTILPLFELSCIMTG